MTQEISIHRGVKHKHVVAFSSFFEDRDNVYILLELCRRRVSTKGLHGKACTFVKEEFFVVDDGAE